MKRPIACLLACSGLFFAVPLTAQLSENGSRISVLNGFNSFANSSSKDSIFFLKGGINLGVQGNYYWKNLGIAGRVGYFTNNASEGKLSDFGLSRKAVPDRSIIATKPYKGFYWMAGPSFQTTFSRWQVESTVLGGLFHHDDAGVYIGDRVSPDIVYYRNKIEAGSAFAWNVGFGLNYAISSLVGLGISADYMSTQSDVINTDINRNGGTQQQALTEQANFLSTALKLTYSLHGRAYDQRSSKTSTVQNTRRQPLKSYFEKGDKPTASQRTTTDCDCENKVRDVLYLEPLTIDIAFNTLQEAQDFLKTSSPLYKDNTLQGSNALYTQREAGSGIATGRRQYKPILANYEEVTNSFELNGKYYVATAREKGSGIATGKRSSIAIDESGVHRGMMVRDSNGEQVFAMLPTSVDLEQVSYLEGGAISVHVQNNNQLKAQNNNTVRSNRTDNALINNKDDGDENGQPNTLKLQNNNTVRSNRTDNALISDDDGLLDIVLYNTAGKSTVKVFRNKLKNFFEEGDLPTEEQYTARDAASGRPTGRRQYQPLKADWDDVNDVVIINDQYYANVITAREAGSGMATGRRQYKPILANFDEGTNTVEVNEQYYAAVNAPRDAASGRPTGRRMHKPVTVRFNEEEDEIEFDGMIYQEVKTAREKGSGIATGRRMKTSFAVLPGSGDSKKTIPVRIIAGDDETAKAIVTNNTTRGGSATLNSQTSTTRQTQGATFGEKVNNGLHAAGGAIANGASRMAGEPIPGIDVRLKRLSDGMIVNALTDENGMIAADILEDGEYEVQAIYNGKWKEAPVAIKVSNQNDVLLKADTDGDGTIELFPSKTVNTSRGNIKSQQGAAARGDKPTTHVHGDPHVDQKDGYRSIPGDNSLEYAIKDVQPVRCENGACDMTCIIIVNGKEYQASVSSVLKTKHDTVKNSINNIR